MPSILTKILSILKKIRIWGIGGIITFLKGERHRRNIQRYWLRDAKQFPMIPSDIGLTLIGMFTQQASHSKVMRDFAHALKQAGIPFQTYNIDPHPNIPPEDIADILTPQSEFHILKYSHVVEILPSMLPQKIGLTPARIAFWEFESGFLHAYPDMPLTKRVIAMSDFNFKYFKQELAATALVNKINYPLHLIPASNTDNKTIRERYGINACDFFVFFNFDFGSSYFRKNPEGALIAFAKAFPTEKNVRLVFKAMRSECRPDLLNRLETLAKDLELGSRLILIRSYIPEQDIFDLTHACDAYLSLHRGEGFGITLAEAMAMGRPVICTNWSATTEFCKEECVIQIPYIIREPAAEEIDHPYYQKVTGWAEPDLDAAAAALRKLYMDPAFRHELGEKARHSISDQFSPATFRQSIDAFLAS